MFAIASDVGYKFDRVQLKKGAYSPIAHGDLQLENQMMRKLLLKVLTGETSIKMELTKPPMFTAAPAASPQVTGNPPRALESA